MSKNFKYCILLFLFIGCHVQKQTISKYGNVNPLAPPETIQYGQFVGTWECAISNLQPDGSWDMSIADWRFSYALDGYAIQDFWTNPKNLEGSEESRQTLGTNIRIYNPTKNIWECVWVENVRNTMNGVWTSRQLENGNIILEDSTQNWKIRFYNISPDSFDWEWNFKQEDESWLTTSKITAKRIE